MVRSARAGVDPGAAHSSRLVALQVITAALAGVCTPADAARVVLSAGLSALGAAGGSVRLLSGTGTELVRLAAEGYGPGMLAAIPERLPLASPAPVCVAVRGRAAVYLPDGAAYDRRFPAFAGAHATWGYAAAAALPLVVGGRILGCLMLSYATPQRFGRSQRAYAATLAEVVAQALDRTRLYEAEGRRAEAAEATAAVALALGSALDPGRLYQLIVEQAFGILPGDHATIALYAGGVATFVASAGEPRIAPGTTAQQGLLWLPHHGGAASYQPDTDSSPGWLHIPPLVGPYRERSVISVPLILEGDLVGSFDVSSRTPRRYTEQHLRIAALCGAHATQALRNARLYAAEQARSAAAEDLARMRSDFVASVSHELRTPLTAMLGFADLLKSRWAQLSEAQRLDHVERIAAAANRQHRLVADLLLSSHVDNDILVVRTRTVLLAGPIHGAAREVRVAYRDQRIQVEGPATLGVRADSDRLQQIVGNLMDNAAKYSPEGSPIAVDWRAEGGMGVIRVRDHGPGIQEAGRDKLFTRFGRMPGSHIRSGHVGTGLGLYLGRHLAKAMDGELSLESTGSGGSTFALRLPLAAEALAG